MDFRGRLSLRAEIGVQFDERFLWATAAVRFLQETAAVDPRRLGALGYGEFHPLADNATAEGRAKNRRIAIVVLPEELAPTDVRPASAPPL